MILILRIQNKKMGLKLREKECQSNFRLLKMKSKIEGTLNSPLKIKIKRELALFPQTRKMKFKNFKGAKAYKYNHFKILTRHKGQK